MSDLGSERMGCSDPNTSMFFCTFLDHQIHTRCIYIFLIGNSTCSPELLERLNEWGNRYKDDVQTMKHWAKGNIAFRGSGSLACVVWLPLSCPWGHWAKHICFPGNKGRPTVSPDDVLSMWNPRSPHAWTLAQQTLLQTAPNARCQQLHGPPQACSWEQHPFHVDSLLEVRVQLQSVHLPQNFMRAVEAQRHSDLFSNKPVSGRGRIRF